MDQDYHSKKIFFDGIMANWVFCTMDNPEIQFELLNQIYNVLQVGSPFVLLINNPYATGIRFASIQSGEPNVNYKNGDPITLRLFRPG